VINNPLKGELLEKIRNLGRDRRRKQNQKNHISKKEGGES
jgi:hypothetical protein